MAVSRARRLATGLVVLAALTAAVAVSPQRALRLVRRVADDPWLLFGVVCLLTVGRPFLAWPTSLLSLIVGFGYGFAGTPLALAALTATSVPPYLLGDRGGFDTGRLAAVTERFTATSDRAITVVGPTRSVAVARLAPVPSDVVSVAAGVAGVPLGPYLLGTALGELPWVLAVVAAGASARTLTTAGLGGLDLRVIGLAGLIAVLLVAGPAVRTRLSEE